MRLGLPVRKELICMDNYGSDQPYDSVMEKILVFHLYLLRKIVLRLILVNRSVLQIVSEMFGFHLSMEVSDRDVWVWDLKEKIPRYHAQVKKVE